MNKNRRDPSKFDETDLDALLKDFFQEEIPDDLMTPPLALGIDASPSPIRAGKRQTGLIGVFALSAVIILLVSFTLNQFNDTDVAETVPSLSDMVSESRNEQSSSRTEIPDAEITPSPMTVLRPQPDLLFYASENMSEYTDFVSTNPERYETPNGPVEQRNLLYTSNKVMVDAETGNGINMTIPELEIEIIEVPEDFE